MADNLFFLCKRSTLKKRDSLFFLSMLQLKVIIGSTRPSRFSEKVLPWLQTTLAKKNLFAAEVLDLRNYPLPFYDQPTSPSQVQNGAYENEVARAWAQKIKEGDAFLVVAAEYNHGPTAVLKNALDSVYAEWNKKPVAFIAYGSVGGARAVEQLREIAIELQMAPIRQAVHIPSPWGMLESDGRLKEGSLDSYTHALEGTLDQLSWWAEALKAAREKSP